MAQVQERENIVKNILNANFLLVRDDEGRTLFTLPMWAVVGALAVLVFLLVVGRRDRKKED
jgi:hypothetical protein